MKLKLGDLSRLFYHVVKEIYEKKYLATFYVDLTYLP